MKIPKQIQIVGRTYKIKMRRFDSTTSNVAGTYDQNQGMIWIDETFENHKRSEDAIWHTFIHEIMHAVDSATGRYLSEASINARSEIWLQILKQLCNNTRG